MKKAILLLLACLASSWQVAVAQPTKEEDAAFAAAKFDLGIGDTATISTVEGNTTAIVSSIFDVATVSAVGVAGANKGFVTTCGTKFCVDGKPWYCAGTNAYYGALKYIMSDNEVAVMMKDHASKGATVLRVWAHYDFASYGMQPSLGVYNEDAIKRLDLALAAAAQQGIRLILVLTNYWPFAGGMQKWVDAVVGSGKDLELFYTDTQIAFYFKQWVKHIVTRTNTITGQNYIDDPTIFAWELANEPRTEGGYEQSKGLKPGSLICNWARQMSDYIKTLDSNHLVTTGEEGFKADFKAKEPHSWINNGYAGGDFSCTINLKSVDYGTMHIYADQWGIPADSDWLGDNFLKDRANIAHKAGKPIVLEEYGMGGTKYLPSREPLFDFFHSEINAADYACSMVWAVSHYSTDSNSKGMLFGSNDNGQGYVFGYDGDGSKEVLKQYAYMKDKSSSTKKQPSSPVSSTCSDNPPSNYYTCQQQQSYGQCNQSWMQGYCLQSCGKCTTCTDNAPTKDYSCQQQASSGKCGEGWMQGYCLKSCGRCT